jgi:ATP-dependent DNA ligase
LLSKDEARRIAVNIAELPELHPGIVLNEHYEGDGEIVFEHACKLGCEGIVSKRLGSPYRSGRSPHWLKVKNPKALAVTREAEEEGGADREVRAFWIILAVLLILIIAARVAYFLP